MIEHIFLEYADIFTLFLISRVVRAQKTKNCRQRSQSSVTNRVGQIPEFNKLAVTPFLWWITKYIHLYMYYLVKTIKYRVVIYANLTRISNCTIFLRICTFGRWFFFLYYNYLRTEKNYWFYLFLQSGQIKRFIIEMCYNLYWEFLLAHYNYLLTYLFTLLRLLTND